MAIRNKIEMETKHWDNNGGRGGWEKKTKKVCGGAI